MRPHHLSWLTSDWYLFSGSNKYYWENYQMQDFLALWWVNFRLESKVIMGYHVFFGSSYAHCPHCILWFNFNFFRVKYIKYLSQLSTIAFVVKSFFFLFLSPVFYFASYSLHPSIFYPAFKQIFINSTQQPVILIANPWKAEIQNNMIFIDLGDCMAQAQSRMSENIKIVSPWKTMGEGEPKS